MERKFKPGDVVRYIFNSKENMVMTVKGYTLDLAKENPTASPFIKDLSKIITNKVVCEWRDNDGQAQTKSYDEKDLTKC